MVAASSGPAGADNTETGLITIAQTNASPQPSGAPSTYSIGVSCQGVGGISCGGAADAIVTIPLLGTNTVPADLSGWAYSASSGTTGLISSGPTVVSNGSGGFNLVMTLSSALFVPGFGGTITLKVTPPDGTTPNNTTWSLDPVLSGGNIVDVVAPTPAASAASAEPLPVISKFTADGGSVYLAGSPVTYNINAACNPQLSTGNLNVTSSKLVDPIPAGMTYTSSTPAGGVYNALTRTVTWTFPTAASSPAGCAPSAAGPSAFSVTALTPTPSPPIGNQPLSNTATFSGTGPDAVNGSITNSTSATAKINLVDVAPGGGGTCNGLGCPTITKTALAPLAIAPGQYQATYPGNWITPSSTPSYSSGAASGSFSTTISFPLTHTYETDVVDPVPCLTNVSGSTYSSLDPAAPACTAPAFHTQVVEVSGPGLGAAVAAGWHPRVFLSNGSVVVLNPTGTVPGAASSAYYSVPAGDDVATIDVPASTSLEGNAISLTMWGYGDASTVNGDTLANTATAFPELPGTPPTPVGSINASATLYILSTTSQLGVAKAFGPLGQGPGGTTTLSMAGSVSVPSALAHDLVFADLLPSGMSWINAPAGGSGTATFTLTQGTGAVTTATAATTYVTNYLGTGRNLIRATIPQGNFTTTGLYTVTEPTNLFEINTPDDGSTYDNTDQLFLSGLAPSQLLAYNGVITCSTPNLAGSSTSSVFESYNPNDLAGDGNVQEDYCQNGATLVSSAGGAGFSLSKTVQGDLDANPVGALGVGHASVGGTGVYDLTWTNVGADPLSNPVIYDILPYVGDTGISQQQAGVPRGSQFAPVLTGTGALPSGVTAEYSQSTNPCRPEVDTAAPGCVNDWTSTTPSTAGEWAQVKALRFVGTAASYLEGSTFSISLDVDVPASSVNEIAWNSAVTVATDATNPSLKLPLSEPPKVGITSLTGGPVLSSATSATTLLARSTTPVYDNVGIIGSDGNFGSLDWSLVGPVSPPIANDCTSVTAGDWDAATTVASGTQATPAADGVVVTGPATVGAPGCYSWVDSYTSAAGSSSLLAGSANETILVTPYSPTIITGALPNSNVAQDGVEVNNTDLGTGGGAPATATLHWNLYGPAPLPGSGSCADVDWTAFPTPFDSGTSQVANGYTQTGDSATLTTPGCYTYTNSLDATTDTEAVPESAKGIASETFQLANGPTVATTAGQATPSARTSVSDSVSLSNTNGFSGTIAWSLVGPVSGTDGTTDCSTVPSSTWSATATLQSGTQVFTGDQTHLQVPTAPVVSGAPGCYSWAETVTGPNFLAPVTVAAGSSATEIFSVQPYHPTIATVGTPLFSAGTNTSTDKVTISGTDLGGPNGAPSSAVLTWKLYGPVAPVTAGTCAGIVWATAPLLTSNTINVVNGSPAGNTTQAATLSGVGCYTYTSALAATTDTLAVPESALGVAAETFEITPPLGISTTAKQATTNPRLSVSDAVTISNTSGNAGSIAWTLVGPVTPPTPNDCSSVTGSAWTAAAALPLRAGTQAFTGNQTNLTVPAAGTTVTTPGCYSWAETITGNHFLGPQTIAAGSSATEIFRVDPYVPTVATSASTVLSGNANTAKDAITIGSSDLGTGIGGPATAVLTWRLYGPATPVTPGSCSGISWASFTVPIATSTINVANGSPAGNTTPSTTITQGPGCYTYTSQLAATTDTTAVPESALGQASESFVLSPVAMTTVANQTTANPRSAVTDAVTISGTDGNAGSIAWSLVGPVAPPVANDCSSVSSTTWSTAAATPLHSGTQLFTGNQVGLVVPTAGSSVTTPGCYSWAEAITGNNLSSPTTVAAGTSPSEIFRVDPFVPALSSTASTVLSGTANTSSDALTISNTDLGAGGGAPASAALTWRLYGPATPVTPGTCAGISWASFTTPIDSGTLNVVNGSPAGNTTPVSTVNEGAGCYTYTSQMAATTDTAAVSETTLGLTTESYLLSPVAAVTTSTTPSPNPAVTSGPSSVSDSVVISGTDGNAGSIAWSLVGPVTPPVANDCSSVSGATWSTAAATPLASGTQSFTGDGTVTVPTTGTTIGTPGCYSWAETFTGNNLNSPTTIAAGTSPTEIVELDPYVPLVTTTATNVLTGSANTSSDAISIANTDLGLSGGAASTALTWRLYGPATPVSPGTCAGISWASFTTPIDSGTLNVVNGSPAGNSTPVSTVNEGAGCYTYTSQLAATAHTAAVPETALGLPSESFDLSNVAIATTANQPTPNPRASVSDSVVLSGTDGNAGSIAWSLVGPVTPPVANDCSSVSGATWSTAAATPLASGTQSFTGDQSGLTVPTAGTHVTTPGCYSWAETITGANLNSPTTIAAGASPTEIFATEPLVPTLATTIKTSVATGDETATDSIVVAGTNLGAGGGAPSTTSLNWTLFGPVAPIANSCATVSWVGAPTADSGTIMVTGNGTYSTTTSPALQLGSCYSYEETLAGTSDSVAVTAPVGVVSETASVPAAPEVTTLTSSATVFPHASISDAVSIEGMGPSDSGTLAWTLVGPVAPIANSCAAVSWAGAPTLSSGSVPITSNGSVTTGPVVVDDLGCYSWTDQLSGTFPGTTTINAGDTSEITLVQPHQPVITTVAPFTAHSTTSKSTRDTITVSGSGIGTGGGAPASAPMTWTLLGPMAPHGSSCATVDWSAAPTLSSGTLTVTGDGTYETPSTALSAVGCYTFTETLAATADSLSLTTTPGISQETSVLLDPATLVTHASVSSTTVGTAIHDNVTVGGTAGLPGTVAWRLVGPVPVAADGTCNGVSWAATSTMASGTITTSAAGTYPTPAETLPAAGCYSWSDVFTGPHYLGATTLSSGMAGEVSLATVAPVGPVGPGGGLAFTGFNALLIGSGGVLAVMLGATLVLIERRRRRT